MKTVAQLLERKGYRLFTIVPEASVFEALEQMAENEVGALLVMEASRLVGLISERDYARKVILKGHTSKKLRVREIMTRRVICARPDETLEECMAVMTDKRVRHLPVLDGGNVVGLVSIGDLVKAIIAEQQFVIEQLENYISG